VRKVAPPPIGGRKGRSVAEQVDLEALAGAMRRKYGHS
jgi:hypothetical protein